MKFFNIIVHGVPYGQDIFSTDPIADESYIKTFYKQQDNPLETLFEIEVRKEGNQQVVYYHYLKRRDVFGAEGRTGSYFGFTLRTDVSCDEVALLFHHMDEVFRTRILGSLLERAGNGYRHLVKKYSQCESVVDSMVLEFNAWLTLPGIRQLFHEIPACPQAKSVSKVCNLEDFARFETVKGALQKGMTVQLSPDVPRNAYLSKMAELNNQLATAAAQQKQAVELAKSESRSEMDRMNKSIQEQKKGNRPFEWRNRPLGKGKRTFARSIRAEGKRSAAAEGKRGTGEIACSSSRDQTIDHRFVEPTRDTSSRFPREDVATCRAVGADHSVCTRRRGGKMAPYGRYPCLSAPETSALSQVPDGVCSLDPRFPRLMLLFMCTFM